MDHVEHEDSSSDDDGIVQVYENKSDNPYNVGGRPSPHLRAATLRCNWCNCTGGCKCTWDIPFSFLPQYILYGGLLMRLTQNHHPTGSYRVVQENNPHGGD